MQFREASSRVQCYAAFYDKDAKRTRQKLVWTTDRYGKIETKPTADELTPANFGSPEQRQKWATEIAKHIDEHNAAEDKRKAEVLPLMLKSTVDGILADLRSKTSHLDNSWHRARMREQAKRLANGLGLVATSKPVKPKKGKETPNAK